MISEPDLNTFKLCFEFFLRANIILLLHNRQYLFEA